MAKDDAGEKDMKPETTDEQEEEFAKAGGGYKKGGRVKAKRKAGGSVEGKMADCRPDRRARGGEMAKRASGGSIDVNPFSAANKLSDLPFVKDQQGDSEGGRGADKD